MRPATAAAADATTDLTDRRDDARDLAGMARELALRLEHLAYGRHLDAARQRLCWRAMSNARLGVLVLNDAREHLERALSQDH